MPGSTSAASRRSHQVASVQVKKYEVMVSPEAQAAILTAFRYIHERAPQNAERWLRNLYSCIGTLESFPGRCASARERKYFEEELRQLVARFVGGPLADGVAHQQVLIGEGDQAIGEGRVH